MLRVERVSFSYEKGRPVLEDLRFQIAPGARVGQIGANGAGKSTLMKLFLGLLPCQEGEIYARGVLVSRENLARVRRTLGFVLQDSDNQMFMPTVYEDMMFAPLNYGLGREEAERRVDAVLERLGLTELKHRYNHKISQGEKRMAAIATILAMILDTCGRVILLSQGRIAADGPAEVILRDRVLLEKNRMELPLCLSRTGG